MAEEAPVATALRSATRIKPCPFCGRQPLPLTSGKGWACVNCVRCRVQMYEPGMNAKEAVVKRWNKRCRK